LLLVLAFFVSVVRPAFAAPTDVVAMVGDQPILMRDIDELSNVQLSKIYDTLSALLARTVERLIDERVRWLTPPEVLAELSQLPVSPLVTEEEVRSYRATHEKDMLGVSPVEGIAGEAGEQAALLRYYLEQKTREAAEAQIRQRLRHGRVIRLSLPRPQELELPMTQERQIAQVDNLWIRALEFEQAAAWRLYQLREEIYRERRRNLEPTIESVLFSSEARRRGITIAALHAELSAKESVSEEEILAFTTAEQEAGRPAPTAERAQTYLEFRKAYDRRQALLKKLRESTPIKIFLKEPPLPHFPVEDSGFAILGAKKGKRLVVYTNYRCPVCRTVQQEIDTLLTQDKKVRVIFHDFIPGFDPVATEAAYLTRCAAQWGVFSRMRQELLTREPPPFGRHWYKESELPQLLRRLRVKKKTEFLDCLGADIYTAIEQETAKARALGFEAPPMFIAEGAPIAGTPTAEELTQALAHGLKVQSQRRQGIDSDDRPRNRRRRGRWSRSEWVDKPIFRNHGRQSRRVRRYDVLVDAPATQRRKSSVRQKSAAASQPLKSRKATPSSQGKKLFDLE
jgi:hypothetical protein